MNVESLARSITEHEECSGLTAFFTNGGWMVSLRMKSGMRVYYGTELEETIERAFANGRQRPKTDDEVWDEIAGQLI